MMTPDEIAKHIDPSLAEHAARYINEIPKEGVLLSTFCIEGLYDAPASVHNTCIERLRKNGVIYIANDGGHRYVFKSASDVSHLSMCREDRIDLFLAEAAPYIRSIKRAIDREAGSGDFEGAARVTKAAQRLSRFTRSRIGKVLPFDGLRRELWLTFSPKVMSRFAMCDRGFNQDASLADMRVSTPQLPDTLNASRTLEDRIFHRVEEANTRGITIAEIYQALNRKASLFRIKERVGDLEGDGRVRSVVMKLDEDSRMARRVFAASIGLPHVREDGVGTWGAL